MSIACFSTNFTKKKTVAREEQTERKSKKRNQIKFKENAIVLDILSLTIVVPVGVV